MIYLLQLSSCATEFMLAQLQYAYKKYLIFIKNKYTQENFW